MASVLIYPEDGSVTVPGPAPKRVLERGDGDAARRYLALLRGGGAAQRAGVKRILCRLEDKRWIDACPIWSRCLN